MGGMSLSFVSSARRRHGGLASAALFNPLVEAVTGALPVIDPATGRPASAGAGDARAGSTGAADAAPAQAAVPDEPSTEAGSARG
ncbi:hypothetical protein KZX69_06445 [Micrococcus luteus]|nr:hypothetical protein [Micrococcus luteus]MCK6062058.1 hypothetical protein [Micrococcus luteus]MCK6064289.1 hypothetical protein [Micrococcus luteus]MCK6192440.1 hypothetical protein [Micrococcus luteus]MCK6194585.1 hypothetical protein [Micrococcus luteus]